MERKTVQGKWTKESGYRRNEAEIGQTRKKATKKTNNGGGYKTS